MLRAADVMTEDPTTVFPETSLVEAARTLDQLAIRHLPVVDEDGELVGMLSDRDLRGVPPKASVSDFMNANVVQAMADDDLIVIANLIVDSSVGAIPIVDGRGMLVGIVSYVDILRSLSRIASTPPPAKPRKPRARAKATRPPRRTTRRSGPRKKGPRK